MTNQLTWTRPELLADADTWAAHNTVMAIIADLGVTPTAERIRHECDAARAWALTQPAYIADRWATAYARVANAL